MTNLEKTEANIKAVKEAHGLSECLNYCDSADNEDYTPDDEQSDFESVFESDQYYNIYGSEPFNCI